MYEIIPSVQVNELLQFPCDEIPKSCAVSLNPHENDVDL